MSAHDYSLCAGLALALAWTEDSIAHHVFAIEVAKHARESAAAHRRRARGTRRDYRSVQEREAEWFERSAVRNHAYAVGLIFGPTLAEDA